MTGPAQRQLRLTGPFQQLVLLSLIRLGPSGHGGALHRYIEKRTGRWISLNAVYTTLSRLERRGYLCTWSRPPIGSRWRSDKNRPAPDGAVRAARRFYSVLPLGRRALRLTLAASDRMQSGLPGFGREFELYRRREPTRSPRPFRFRSRKLHALYGTWARCDPRWLTIHLRQGHEGAPDATASRALDARPPPSLA